MSGTDSAKGRPFTLVGRCGSGDSRPTSTVVTFELRPVFADTRME